LDVGSFLVVKERRFIRGFWLLGGLAKFPCWDGEGSVLWFIRWWVPELLETLQDVLSHAAVDPSLIIIPLEMDAQVEIALPILAERVIFLDGISKVLGVVSADVLDAEVINGQGESNRSRDVPP